MIGTTISYLDDEKVFLKNWHHLVDDLLCEKSLVVTCLIILKNVVNQLKICPIGMNCISKFLPVCLHLSMSLDPSHQ